jgi:2-iminobutanoate/2-iminopropanoate deaminase
MKFIETQDAPKAVGPYSQGVLVKDTLYVSGQLPFDPKTMTLISTDIKKQTQKCLENVLAIVEAAGLKKENIARCGVFMKDLSKFGEMNEIYANFFNGHKPARAAIEVSRLPKDVDIEIDCIAVIL